MNIKFPSGGYQVPISKAAVNHIKDIVQCKKSESEPKLPEGYHPPDIALSPSLPESSDSYDPSDSKDGYIYGVQYDLNGYMQKAAEATKANGSNKTSRDEPMNVYESYMSDMQAYQKILKECDDDVAYCENLVKNNTDPLQKDCYQELLNRANIRRKNISKQVADRLSSSARGIAMMNELNAKSKRIKRMQEGKQDDPQVTAEIENLNKRASIFQKIGRLDFKRLLENPNDAAATFEYLYKTVTENFGGFLRD